MKIYCFEVFNSQIFIVWNNYGILAFLDQIIGY